MITKDIDFACEKLAQGELVAFPTETVFGLGARADDEVAVKKIFTLKNRPEDHPLISHCTTIDQAFSAVKDIPEYAKVLAEKFWPGPMTLILNSNNDGQICSTTRGGHETVAIRIPSHIIAQKMLSRCDFFVAAPSANKFGRVSPTTASHVRDEFGEDITILDGEQSQRGLESTIISCLTEAPQILRAGFITRREVEQTTGLALGDTDLKTAAPGTLEKHYAPSIQVVAIDDVDEVENPNLSSIIALEESLKSNESFKFISVHATMEDFAYALYSFFRESELIGVNKIYVIKPPMAGIGIAINDRVAKAESSGK